METALIALYLAVLVVVIAGMWKTFAKTGAPGWASIVPFYNVYVMTKMADRPAWWVVLVFVPIVNIVIAVVLSIEIARGFEKSANFGIGLAFLGFIFWPILGFGRADWRKSPVRL